MTKCYKHISKKLTPTTSNLSYYMAIPVCSTTYSEKIIRLVGIQTEDKEVAQIALVGV